MSIKETLSLTPENLAEKQEEALKHYVIGRLNNIIDLIQKSKYSEVDNLLGYSPSGDGHGEDNSYILFDEFGSNADIGDVIQRLMALNTLRKSR
jgi:hypothetical protein